ncbi:MAG: hypothetical protein M1820_004293 [Bogoriella megaspora]|nr:MAG: hypothetical protein M1820_004293 [Bogoriella megaspora]
MLNQHSSGPRPTLPTIWDALPESRHLLSPPQSSPSQPQSSQRGVPLEDPSLPLRGKDKSEEENQREDKIQRERRSRRKIRVDTRGMQKILGREGDLQTAQRQSENNRRHSGLRYLKLHIYRATIQRLADYVEIKHYYLDDFLPKARQIIARMGCGQISPEQTAMMDLMEQGLDEIEALFRIPVDLSDNLGMDDDSDDSTPSSTDHSSPPHRTLTLKNEVKNESH